MNCAGSSLVRQMKEGHTIFRSGAIEDPSTAGAVFDDE